jgi:hypothetical protein
MPVKETIDDTIRMALDGEGKIKDALALPHAAKTLPLVEDRAIQL